MSRSTVGIRHGVPRLLRGLPLLAVLLAAAIALLSSGVAVRPLASYSLYLVGVILLPGVLSWRIVMRRYERANPNLRHSRLPVEDWVCGASIGLAAELISYVIARWTGHPQWFVVGPLTLGVVLGTHELRRRGGRGEKGPRPDGSLAASSVMAAILVYLICWLGITLFLGHPLEAVALTDPDEMFHRALVGELRHHFPPTYPYVEYPGRLTYQWFVHAHQAAGSWATGVPAETLYRRFDPLVLTVLSAAGTAVLAVRMSQRLWAGPLSVAILVLVGSFDITGTVAGEAAPEERFLQGSILMHSPTQTLAFLASIPVTLLACEMVRRGARVQWTNFSIFFLLALYLSGAKVTFLPMVACGFIAAVVVSAWRYRDPARAGLLGLCLVVASIGVSGWGLYGGETHTLEFEPLQSARYFMGVLGIAGHGIGGLLIVSVALLVMWLIPAMGMVGLAMGSTRWDLRVWLLLGTGSAGLGAVFLLGHVGNSQVYFGRSAAIALAVLGAWGLLRLYPPNTSRHTAAQAVGLSLCGGVLLVAVRYFTEQWREPAPLGGELIDSPVLRLWMNLPAVLGLGVLIWGIAIIARDLDGPRVRITLRGALVFLVGLGLARSFAFLAGNYPEANELSAKSRIGMDGRRAAEWIRAHSHPRERVITNAHCGPAADYGPGCDARHFWMSGLTQRRFVLEGWAYTARSNLWTDPFWGDHDFLRKNDALFTSPSQLRLSAFLEDHPARWMLVDLRQPVEIAELRGLRGVRQTFAEGDFAVLEIVR